MTAPLPEIKSTFTFGIWQIQREKLGTNGNRRVQVQTLIRGTEVPKKSVNADHEMKFKNILLVIVDRPREPGSSVKLSPKWTNGMILKGATQQWQISFCTRYPI